MRRLAIFILILLGLVGVTILLIHPALRIREIDINHTDFISEHQLKATYFPLKNHSAIRVFWLVHTASRFRHPFRQVADVDYTLHFPNHLLVHLNEKKPWIAFVLRKKIVVYAKDGTLLNTTSAQGIANPNDVIIIRGLPAKYQSNHDLAPDVLAQMTEMIQSIQRYLPNSNLQIDFLPNGHITLLKDDVLPIKIGELTDIDKKFKNLSRFLVVHKAQDPPRPIHYIDLRIPTQVVVRYEI